MVHLQILIQTSLTLAQTAWLITINPRESRRMYIGRNIRQKYQKRMKLPNVLLMEESSYWEGLRVRFFPESLLRHLTENARVRGLHHPASPVSA